MDLVSENRCFGGRQQVLTHRSAACDCDMTFGAYLPPQADDGPVPVLWYLSGLTCTHENAMTKGGFQEHAARHGIAVIFPDTSPRGEGVADDEAFDMGQGAGFYLDATQEPWAEHFQMARYILSDLRSLVVDHLPVADRHGITGHSMGGHGALTLAMRYPEMFDSLSAFAPVANPSRSDWGRKQFAGYLGEDADWTAFDASELLSERGWKSDMLIDQGTGDQFLDLLKPEALASAMAERRQAGHLRLQEGYDHSYFFVSTFAEDHVRWHAERLRAG